MNSTREYWQIAAGDSDRNYADICLKWDVVLNGPGSLGAWPSCETKLTEGNWSSRKISNIRRFCEDIKEGDIVVLRMGTSDVMGVGVVVGGYTWSNLFSDVDGWDVQHARRVKWLWKGLDAPKVFDTYTLKLGDTTQKLSSSDVKNWVDSLKLPLDGDHTPNELPNDESFDLKLKDISESLFDFGVSSLAIETLSGEIDELIRIANWYNKYNDPSEHETVAYLVVPLLRALGWTPQKMGIEWNSIDIALFSELPRDESNLSVVVEAKKMGKSCLTAAAQAEGYTKGRKKCERLIVTDGLRYGVYTKKNNDQFSLYAYFNITRLKNRYPIYDTCLGAKEALQTMTPEWKNTFQHLS